ncbi:EndoU domain-containing protein [Lysinibacillus sp. RSDA_15]|uniref:EndoU domain-containing protein n=1 Tax=Lysinibacillus sp. RSDA_15 TaxID=3391421 RepID=UPI003A4D6A01
MSKAKQQAAVKQTKQVVKEKVLPVVKKAAQATTKAVKNAVKPKNLLNTLQVGLDLVGLIPGFGEIADGVNGIIYLARGDKVNAALSFGAMIPFSGWAATGGKLVNKGAGVVKSVAEGVRNVLKGPVGSVVDQVKKQVVNVKTQIQSKVAEVKQQLRQMVQSQQQNFALAGGDVRYIEDTGTVGRNTPTPSPKPSNTQPSQNGSNKKPTEDKGTGNNSKPVSGDSSIITPEMKEKILLGQRKNPNKNEIIGGHSSTINNSHSNYATEVIKINPDGTKDIKYITQFPDGNISKIKNSTTFPEGWSDLKILDSITDIGNSPSISIRGRDGATLHRGIVDGVEIDVIKIGDTVVSGYPTGQINAPLPGGFSK